MKNIGIIGLGLIGGSIAKAIKASSEANIIAFNRSEQALIDAKNDGIVSEFSTTDMSIFKNCDIIFLCTPVDKIVAYVEKLKPFIKKDCIITDVGSTKNQICEKMKSFKDIAFIGGHPMAGSEKTGYKAANEHLYENAFYILTPSETISEEQTERIVALVEQIGAIPIVISPKHHDYIVSAISHVPHIIAATLVNMVEKLDDDKKHMHTLAAGGFKDITRIASSSPEMWSGICSENKAEILNVVSEFKNTLTKFEDNLKKDENDKIFNFFEASRDYRNSFAEKKVSVIAKYFELNVDIIDRPGSIATIATLLSVNNINIKNIGINNNREFSGGVLQIIFASEEDKNKSIALLEEMNYTIYKK